MRLQAAAAGLESLHRRPALPPALPELEQEPALVLRQAATMVLSSLMLMRPAMMRVTRLQLALVQAQELLPLAARVRAALAAVPLLQTHHVAAVPVAAQAAAA